MVSSALIASLIAGLVPAVLGQANTSYVDYSTEPQPNLTPLTVALIQESFPDCVNGPLSPYTVCNTSANYRERAASLVSLMTLEELINNTGNTAGGAPRLGLPNYQVWSETLHGLDRGNFTDFPDAYSWSTNFPMPILSMASLNRTLINLIGSIIGTQGRSFNNAGRFGLDGYDPNINGFRSPLWGRGQETPGEDAFLLSSAYAYELITGMQGGVGQNPIKLVATAKHYAGYDLENWNNHSRLGNDLSISQQDLAGYYTPQFKTAVSQAKTGSVMCSYNAVNGVPSCANSYFLQTLLRDTWGFDEYEGYVSSDCDAIYNIWNPHGYASDQSSAAADGILAGTDIDCGTTYQYYLNSSVDEGLVSREKIETAVARLYAQLVQVGYFDGNSSSEYRQLSWADVLSTDAQNISYEAAVEGIVLLKNDGTLPLASSVKSVALIGPWANATIQMQGNYFGPPPYLTSPLAAFEASDLTVNYAFGTNISSTSTSYFAEALAAANASDVIVFVGGIDNTVEAEGQDRQNITWPGNQLTLIEQLSALGKPVIVLQMGGGQVDSSPLKDNVNVNSLIWGGYPGQSGGNALLDIITGARAPAGRLTATQYPAEYAYEFPATDLGLRPNGSNPGQTYMWYTGSPVYEFGLGLFYTNFSAAVSDSSTAPSSFSIQELIEAPHPDYATTALQPFTNFTVTISNTGTVASDYSAMLFANTSNAGPAPYPNKWLVGFDRLASIAPGASAVLTIPVVIGSVARTDVDGNSVLYPGDYEFALNTERSVVVAFTLTGNATTLTEWPLWEQQVGTS